MTGDITQKTRVVAVDSESVWVESSQESTCSGCQSKAGCGQHWLSKLSGRQPFMKIEAPLNHTHKVGDTVLLSINANSLVLASVMAYGTPLICMIAVLILGRPWLTSAGISIIAAAVAFLAGSVAVYYISRQSRLLRYFKPKIVQLIR